MSSWATYTVALSGEGVNMESVAYAWAESTPRWNAEPVGATVLPSMGVWLDGVEAGAVVMVEAPNFNWLVAVLHNVHTIMNAWTMAHVTRMSDGSTWYVNGATMEVEKGVSG